jgi:pyridoxine kinase
MEYKRILTIQDISCLGQCSTTVALPVLSACGHEVCILPPAILSTHTGGFGIPAIRKLTDNMAAIRSHWEEQKITFDLILTGYLGSIEAIDEVNAIVDSLLAPGGKLIVDPAMADHGKLYRGFDNAYAAAMKQLCSRADIIVPNITETAMMTGMPYLNVYNEEYIHQLLNKLDGKCVLLTGVGFNAEQTGYALRTSEGVRIGHHKRLPGSFHGTGDLFAAAFVGALACDKSVQAAAEIASKFTLRCICNTLGRPAHWYGVKFETALPYLMELLNT